jgi:hypothetical protein
VAGRWLNREPSRLESADELADVFSHQVALSTSAGTGWYALSAPLQHLSYPRK